MKLTLSQIQQQLDHFPRFAEWLVFGNACFRSGENQHPAKLMGLVKQLARRLKALETKVEAL